MLAGQQVPSILEFQAFSIGLHWIQVFSAEGSITKNRVTTQNQTNQRRGPVVKRRRVIPKDIFDNVEAKQDTEAPTEVAMAMVAKFSTAMSCVRFPNPRRWPI